MVYLVTNYMDSADIPAKIQQQKYLNSVLKYSKLTIRVQN